MRVQTDIFVLNKLLDNFQYELYIIATVNVGLKTTKNINLDGVNAFYLSFNA